MTQRFRTRNSGTTLEEPIAHARRVGGRLALCLLAGFALPVAVGAKPSDAAGEQALDRFVGQFVDLAMFDGTVLVDVGGDVVYKRSFGYASYELEARHTPTTRFRIASVSKFLTDVAIARFVDRGELSLEAPVSRYLPEFPRADEITVRHLVEHTSGIPHTNSQPWGDGKISLSLRQILDRLAALPLDFDPGSDSSYSNGGYAVAARVLEVLGGDSYSGVMRSVVLDPLAMTDTDHIGDVRSPIPGMATGYEPGKFPGERRHSRFYAVEVRPGGGSLYSTAPDLLRLARAVFRQGFVSAESRRELLGVTDEEFVAGGRSPGFVTNVYYDRERDVIVVSLANSYAVPADWGRAIADIVTLGEPSDPWPDLRPAGPNVALDDPRLGRYRSSYTGREVVLERSERGAMVVEDGRSESTTAMIPLADGSHLQPLYFQRCERDEESGAITCRILSGNPRYVAELVPVD